MGIRSNFNFSYRFLLFFGAWLVFVGVLWINYRDWIIYDWGLPLLPWVAVLGGVYAADLNVMRKRKRLVSTASKTSKKKAYFTKTNISHFTKECFWESWHGLKIELIIVVIASVLFSIYYFFVL